MAEAAPGAAFVPSGLVTWEVLRPPRTYVKGVISPGPLPSNFLDHA